jgi:hypothetical protein
MPVGSDTNNARWVESLRLRRHGLVHEYAPFLAFDGKRKRPEPVLVLDWRPGKLRQGKHIPFALLRRVLKGLPLAAEDVRRRLVRRIERTP